MHADSETDLPPPRAQRSEMYSRIQVLLLSNFCPDSPAAMFAS